MTTKHFLKAGIFTLLLTVLFIAAWEYYWRSKGFKPTFNDDAALWTEKREEAYQPANEATVFIGSSRIKFDLDIPTWEEVTGEEAIQLALVGTSPRKVLENLAEDENFRGKLVIDVTEGIFFSVRPGNDQTAIEAIEFYENLTPSQRASSFLNMGLESKLVFLEERRFGFNELLKWVPLKNRPGVFAEPAFPMDFEWTTRDRQTYMAAGFLADTNKQRRQKNIWTGFGILSRSPGMGGDTLQNVFKKVKAQIDKIRARGGQVMFVRTPSSGEIWEAEKVSYPREKYWEALLEYTGTPGIHFKDYPETSNYICPEWSHLALSDCIDYTRHLKKQLEEKGWTFKNTVKP